jgi:TetR/AcrR family transcriptional repressor of nem operon
VAHFPAGLALDPARRTDLGTQDRIVYTAERLFVARSVQHVSVNEICASAGVLKGSFYHWFAAKEDLARTVIDDIEAGYVEMLDRYEKAARGPVNKIRATAEVIGESQAALAKTFRRIIGCPLGTISSELAVVEPKVASHASAAMARWQERLAGHCRDAEEVGLLSSGTDPEDLARLIMATMRGMILLSRIDKLPIPVVTASMDRVLDAALRR